MLLKLALNTNQSINQNTNRKICYLYPDLDKHFSKIIICPLLKVNVCETSSYRKKKTNILFKSWPGGRSGCESCGIFFSPGFILYIYMYLHILKQSGFITTRGCLDSDLIEARFTSTNIISAYHHLSCKSKSC